MSNENKDNFVARFVMDHPIVTFLICETAASAVRSIVVSICNTISYGAYAKTFTVNNEIKVPNWMEKKETTDEQAEQESSSEED